MVVVVVVAVVVVAVAVAVVAVAVLILERLIPILLAQALLIVILAPLIVILAALILERLKALTPVKQVSIYTFQMETVRTQFLRRTIIRIIRQSYGTRMMTVNGRVSISTIKMKKMNM